MRMVTDILFPLQNDKRICGVFEVERRISKA